MNPEQLAALAGVLLSLFFAYVPGASDWFEGLASIRKRLVMAGLLLLVAGGALALSCAGIVPYVTCDQAGALALVNAFLAALVANQATFLITGGKPQSGPGG